MIAVTVVYAGRAAGRSVAAEIKLPGRLVAPDFSRLITDGTWAVQSVLNNYCDFEVQDIYLKTRYQE